LPSSPLAPDAPFLVAVDDPGMSAALHRALAQRGHSRVSSASGVEAIEAIFASEPPAYVVLAGPSGGIGANQRRPADLMAANLRLDAATLELARQHGVRRLLYLGSSCMYPRVCDQPMNVSSLLAGPLEPTSAPYATAKLAGMKLVESYRRQHGCEFIAAIPAGTIGPEDHFDPEDSHVAGALLTKMHAARVDGLPFVELWGTGTARRELMAADDLADAVLFLLEDEMSAEPVNIGSGAAVSIRELAEIVRDVVGFGGELRFDTSKPDGAPEKRLDAEPLRARGWAPKVALRDALALAYEGLKRRHEAHARATV
jgi:GDP-L-fucose synthase